MAEMVKVSEKPCEGSRAHVAMVTNWGNEIEALKQSTHELSYQSAKDMHEKGKHSKGGGKQVKLNAQTSESTSILPTDIGEQTPCMIWEQVPILDNVPEFKYIMAPNKDKENSAKSPTTQALNIGLMAMCYNPNEGWVTSKLSPTSGHWKRMARVVKQSKPRGE